MIFQFILAFVIFFVVNYGAYWITEKKGLPEWLQYKPWICRMCLTFWSLIAIYVAIWVSYTCLVIGISGILLACMNAAAMYIHQKTHTVKIDDL